MRYVLACLLAVALPTGAAAQIGIPNTFVPQTRIQSSLVNENFSELGSKACNRTGCTMTGTLTSLGIVPNVHDTYVLGASGTRYANIYSVLGNFSGAVATGNLTVTGTAAISGNVAINTDKFTVVASSGNTVVGGSLGVTGNATVGGTLGVTGDTSLAGALDVNGLVTVGSGNVQPFTAGGKIQAISSTYFDSLDGTNLTGVAKLGSNNTFTGRNDLKLYSETVASPTISGGALTLDLSAATQFTVTANGNATITISNPVPNGTGGAFSVLFLQDGTARTLTWPAAVKWASGAAYSPTGTNTKIDIITCVYNNGGTTYYCAFNANF